VDPAGNTSLVDGQWRRRRHCALHREHHRAQAAETALRESEKLLHLFIEHAPVSLAMFDREMRYLAVSRQYLEEALLVGREVIGHSAYEIFPNCRKA